MGLKGVFDRETPSLCTGCIGEDRGTRWEVGLSNEVHTWPTNDLATKIDSYTKILAEGNSFPPPFLTSVSYTQKWLILPKGLGGFITNGVNETCLNGWIGTVFCM